MLQGTMCYPGTTTPGTKAYVVTGSSELGTTVTASLSTPLVAAPAATANLTTSAQSVNIVAAADGTSAAAPLNVSFEGGTSSNGPLRSLPRTEPPVG